MKLRKAALVGALAAARLLLALGAVEPTFEHCCRLGSSGARAGQECVVATSPLPGVAADEQAMCAAVSAICCTRKLRQMQCSLGTEAAKNSQSCLVNSDEPAKKHYKDCCEGCKLGLAVGRMGMGCSFTRFKLGHPWENSFSSCCADRSPVSPVVPALRPSTQTPPGGAGRIVESDSENICDLFVGQLCAHLCVSVPGSYRCECRPGFVLGPDAKSCTVDTTRDRCDDDNPCADICTDTGVDIRCSCQEGFQLAPDQVNCLDVDECLTRQHECRPGHMCFNEPGAYGCLDRVSREVYRPGRPAPAQPPAGRARTLDTGGAETPNPCPEGFTLNPTSQLCDDIDECEDPSSCGDQACQNSVGSYQCIPQISPCPSGFVFNPNLQTCIDIDECLEGKSTCDPTSEFCLNTQGGFTCQPRRGPQDCPAGFKYDAKTSNCQDVDECEEDLAGCSGDSEVCRNTVGGYECDVRCQPGYSYSVLSRTCIDIDECAEGLDECQPQETCENEPGTYRCRVRERCPPGYRPSLLYGVDCEDIDECAERRDNCSRSQGQTCMNTEGGFNCIIRCEPGFRFSPQLAGCRDVDECAENLHNCTSSSTCVNTEGSFRCRSNCPLGYRPSTSGSCDDIDECAEGSHNCRPGQTCTNEPGTFRCVANTTCIEGFQYSYVTANCEDIDECAEGRHGCARSHRCVNTVGSFTCIARIPNCPSGFRYNEILRDCVDVDECKEGGNTCDSALEYCVNTVGSFECNKRIDPIQCATGFQLNPANGICEDIDECELGQHSCRLPLHCVNIRGSFTCSRVAARGNVTSNQRCPAGYKFLAGRCRDIDECAEGKDLCNKATERCVNEQGGYRCRESRAPPSPTISAGSTICDDGYRLSTSFGRCLDINECVEQPDVCGTQGTCINTRGSFSCQCEVGFKSDKETKRCADMNECQLDIHSCVDNQRCDNTIGSFVCIRTAGCGTGYTLNSQLGVCEDDDECELGRDNCASLGPKWICNNIEGSFRCVKKRCKQGERLTAAGRCVRVDCRPGFKPDRAGRCKDINECENDPCGANFRCENSPGSFACVALLDCQRGFAPSQDGTICVDIDECAEGKSTCSADQVCTNTPGAYECACQAGYFVNRNNRCEDVDECRTYGDKVCSGSSQCVNTPGSYMCRCAEGYKQGSNPRICVDEDECEDRPGVCHQKCINTWGSFKCGCNDGYRLHSDGRNCVDVDECEEARQLSYGSLCIGLCVNEPGSFRCRCPQGYVLGPESRQCQDINECTTGNQCSAEEVCLNTRGGFRCNKIDCPPNYERDDAHRNEALDALGPRNALKVVTPGAICHRSLASAASQRPAPGGKRKSLFCRDGDSACLRRPLSFSYNFLTFVSKLPIPPLGRIDLFTMRGPLWSRTTVRFQLKLVSARPGARSVARVTDAYFQLRRLQSNQAVVSLVRSVEGPQEIELELTMDLYQGARFSGKAVAKLFVFVTQYEF